MADEPQSDTIRAEAVADIPQYVFDHAPLVYLSSKDPYLPSSLAAHLQHTRPQISFADTPIPSPPLTIANLDQLNALGNAGTDVYLTCYDDISKNPKWLEGIKPSADGGTGGQKTSVIVVADKGDVDGKSGGKGVVDVFYFYFWSFNWGGVVLGNQLGDHVGDWEHNMIRFVNGVPKYVWFSQHSNGEAFTFECLTKDQSGKRPIAYAANGSHALYPSPGTHDHTIPNFNLPVPFLLVDETDAGPLYDPLLTSYFYASPSPQTPTFTPYNPTDPVAYLNYKGRWGDAEYPASDPRQKALVGNKKYVGGPTGPADKQIGRREVWPESSFSKGQKIRTSLGLEGLTTGKFGQFLQKVNCFGGQGIGKKVKRVKVSGEVI